jgi:DNA replication protein DnaC
MITSNLPFSKWESIFKDPMTTAAAIDRLVRIPETFTTNSVLLLPVVPVCFYQ